MREQPRSELARRGWPRTRRTRRAWTCCACRACDSNDGYGVRKVGISAFRWRGAVHRTRRTRQSPRRRAGEHRELRHDFAIMALAASTPSRAESRLARLQASAFRLACAAGGDSGCPCSLAPFRSIRALVATSGRGSRWLEQNRATSSLTRSRWFGLGSGRSTPLFRHRSSTLRLSIRARRTSSHSQDRGWLWQRIHTGLVT